MPGLYTVTTRTDSETITAAKYNADHQAHIDNMIPAQTDDYSGSVSEMRTQIDPGEQGSESQPTSLAGELARIRFRLAEITGKTYWYETADNSLQKAAPGSGDKVMAAQVFG